MWVLLAINVLSLWFGLKYRPKISTEGQSDQRSDISIVPQIVFMLVIVGMLIYAITNVWNLAFITRVFPITVGLITLAFAAAGLVVLARNKEANALNFDSESGWQYKQEGFKTGPYHYVFWVAGFMVATYLIGFILSIFLFFRRLPQREITSQALEHPHHGAGVGRIAVVHLLCVRGGFSERGAPAVYPLALADKLGPDMGPPRDIRSRAERDGSG